MVSRNPERDREIFRAFCLGEQVDVLAERHALTVSRIRQVVAVQRGRLPGMSAAETREELKVQLDDLRRQLHAIVDSPPAIAEREYDDEGRVTAVKLDHSGRIAAARQIVAVQNRMAKMLGLDSPEQVEATTTVRYELVGVDPEEL
jgi:hypothetical protein